MSEFTKMDFSKYNSKNDTENILIKEIESFLVNDEEYLLLWTKLSESEKKKISPWLYRVLKDRNICKSCTTLNNCPKSGRQGKVYTLLNNYASYVLSDVSCVKLQEREKYLQNMIYSDEEPLNFFKVSSEVSKGVKEGKSVFFNTALNLAKYIKNLESVREKPIYYLMSLNDNSLALLYFAVVQGLAYKRKITYIDCKRSLSNFYNTKDKQENSVLLSLQSHIANSDIVILANLDFLPRYTSCISSVLLPLIQKATSEEKMLIMSSSLSFKDTFYIPNAYGKVAKNPHIERLEEKTNFVEIKEPKLFSF